MKITETLKLIEKFPKISGGLKANSEVVIDLLYRYHFNEFLRSSDSNTSVDEHLMILTNSYCQRYKHKSANEFGDLILNIASTGLACPTKKLFIVLHVIQNECADIHLNFKLRLAFLGLSYDFNQLELKKADVDCDMFDIMAAEAELSEFFVFLSDVLINFPEIYRECILTAFTLNPSEQLYEKIKYIASSQGLDKLDGMPNGSIPAITNTGYLVAFNYNPFESPNCVMDNNDIDIDVREDLSRAITHPRLKFISWGMPYVEFCDICEKIMTGQKEDFVKNVVALANENLEYVDIDFSRFKDLPEKEGDDGIEKGYHMFLDDDDTSEEDDDKTMTSPEAAELIREAEIRLKKKTIVLKRKRTICKKLMKNGVPMKKILMKAPPRKIPRPPNCNRIDWKHIDELKEYFKEHSHLVKATQMFNDAQTLIDKLSEMSSNREHTPAMKSTNTAMEGVSGDLSLSIIPIDPSTGVVVNNPSTSNPENFPSTSLVLSNSIDQDTYITNTSNITATNLPTPSTSMTLENPCDPVAVITTQLLQLLDDVDAELRLHYRRQKNYLASIKRKMGKSGHVVDRTNTDSKPNQLDSITHENVTLEPPTTPTISHSCNIPIDENVNQVNTNVENIRRENFDELTPNFFDNNGPSVSTDLLNFAHFTETPTYQPLMQESNEFVNSFNNPFTDSFMPNPAFEENLQSHPISEEVTNHYDEIINMVATSYVDETCDAPVDKQKTIKKRKKRSVTETPANESIIPQMVSASNAGVPIALSANCVNSESNGLGQYNLSDDPSIVTKPKAHKNKKKQVEGGADHLLNDPQNPQINLGDGTTEMKPMKKPRKPRGKNKPKKEKLQSDQVNAEAFANGNINHFDVNLGEGEQKQPTPDGCQIKKERKTPKIQRPKMPRLSDNSDGSHFTPNCKRSDIPDDVLTDRGNSYMDSIDRAIRRVMAGVDIDIQPQRSGNTDEMTMLEIDGVLDNILNMNNGVLINREDCKVCLTGLSPVSLSLNNYVFADNGYKSQ